MSCSSSWSPVHLLWPRSECRRRSELDVLLFHGLQFADMETDDAWRSTWTQRGNDSVCWPQEWLPSDLGGDLRIFSMSYDARVPNSPYEHVSHIGRNLLRSLVDSRYDWCQPIVLIGHSFGGLALKSLVVELERESNIRNPTDSLTESSVQHAKMFLRNLRGVAFYAVPHIGSSNLSEYVKKLSERNLKCSPGIAGNIQPWQRDMVQLSVDFDRIATGNNIVIYAFCEGRAMGQLGILVDFSSAQQLAGNNAYTVQDADHMEVCKPPNKEHPSYEFLLRLIITCRKVSRECDEEVHDLPESFGLESHVERLETLLTSEGSDAAPRYVGVWGMGGVGKTLLLQRLDGSPKVRRHFQGAMFIWLTVGQTPDIMALYRTLSKKLHLEPELYENPEDFKRYLHTEFIQRRVFLVLDDVWQDKAFDSLSLAKGKGSVTLLSTRNKSLLERPTPPITQKQMDRLSKEDSWSLFCVHAFGQPSNVPCELRDLAQDIAEECQGNPLALKVIGKAMFRMALCEWAPLLKKLRESRMSEASVQLELYQRLKPCYDVLSDDDRRLKDCFLYFAAYPEDFRIDFHEMLYYWIGEAWVPGDCADDPRLDAFSLLRKLWKRSLIESDQCYLLDEGNVLGEDLSFNIHDVMRDLAFHILGNDRGTPPARQLYFYRAGRNLEEFPREWEEVSEALRVSLMSNKLTNLPQRFYAPKLVSLLLGGNSIRSVPTSFLSNLRELKVLDLSHGQFDSLPDKLGDLENLVCLDLSYCKKLKNLPETVGKLHVLKCLLLHGCWELKYLPSVVANLTSLQVLHVVANLTSLQVLQTIDSQRLTWSEHRPSGMPRAESLCHADPIIRASLEDICRLVVLTQLSICGRNNRGLVLPDQMPNCFKQLQDLDLWEFEDLDIPSSFTRPGAFPALAQLRIDARKLVEFPDVQKGALPKLRKLDLHGCISLERLPSLEFLPSLEQYYF